MNRTAKLGMLLVLGIAAGLACRFAVSQTPQADAADPVADLFAEARPHLEKALGYPLPDDPVFRPTTPEELDKVPAWEVRGCLAWRFPGGDREPAYAYSQRLLNQGTVARFMEGTNTILVLPENCRRIASWDESLRGADSPQFLQLALVRAAALYALENRHQLLDKKYDPTSLEEFDVSMALREGRAEWVTRQVARALGTDEYFPLLAAQWLKVPESATDPKLRAAGRVVLRQKHWSAVKGFAFFDHLDTAGVGDPEKTAFTRAPGRVDFIENPPAYVDYLRQPGLDWKAVFTRVEQTHRPLDSQSFQQPWTPGLLQQVASTLGAAERVEKLAQEWVDGRTVVWSGTKDPARYVSLSLVQYRSREGAVGYFGLAADLQRKQDEWLRKALGQATQVEQSRFAALTLKGTEEAMRNDKTFRKGKGEAVPMTVVVARRGPLVIEIHWQGVPADLDWAAAAVDTLLTEAGAPAAGN